MQFQCLQLNKVIVFQQGASTQSYCSARFQIYNNNGLENLVFRCELHQPHQGMNSTRIQGSVLRQDLERFIHAFIYSRVLAGVLLLVYKSLFYLQYAISCQSFNLFHQMEPISWFVFEFGATYYCPIITSNNIFIWSMLFNLSYSFKCSTAFLQYVKHIVSESCYTYKLALHLVSLPVSYTFY